MKKVLIFIVALLALCSYSANAVENEEYEVIVVLHHRTKKWVVNDTLFGNNVIYTKQKALAYAISRIPERFVDTSEEFCVYTRYYVGEEKVVKHYYWLKYLGFCWKHEDITDEFERYKRYKE